jgi:peptidoglycan/xylan/chitin deacetylase (PgdA/CDA1 family)
MSKMLLPVFGASAEKHGNARAATALVRGRGGERRVYLTFDDGPDPEWTPRILDLLASAGASATFFVIGRLARQHPHLVRRLSAAGHAVGNHTWSHRHPWTVLASVGRSEVRDGAAAIADALGRAPQLFRPPHGRMRRCMVEEALRGGQAPVLWSRSAIDWGALGHASGIAARLRAVQAGDIVLMHDGGGGVNRPRELARVLPAFLADLVHQDLTARTLHGTGDR